MGVALVGSLLAGAGPVVAQVEPEGGACGPPEAIAPPERELYKGTDRSRNLLLYNPDRITQYPCPYPAEFRAIVVRPNQLQMVQGGQLIRRIQLGPTGSSTTYTLPRIAALVNDPGWVAELSPGVFQVDAAIFQRESTMTVAAPEVTEVRLGTRPHVFIGGSRSTALFDGVKVTSWDPAANGPDRRPEDGRGFINYEQGSRFDINRSEFTFLGSDRTSAYGVSWRTGGTTGRVLDSTFAENFFGPYTFEARNIEFRRNVFRNNTYYGLDPHTGTSGLVVEDNDAYGNGTHGIIFSQTVTDSIVRNNRVHDNGYSGIVLHSASDRNRVEGNVVERNRDDGIVLLGSGHSVIERNTVRRNGAGIRINQLGADRVTVVGNVLEDNRTGIQAYDGATESMVADNVIRRSGTGAIIDSPLSRVVRNQIVGARVGLDLESVVEVRDVQVSDVNDGLVARSAAIVDAENVEVRAKRTGARLDPGAVTTMRDVRLMAPNAVARRVARPSSWADYLPFVGIGAVLAAVGLDVLRRVRSRGQPQIQAPPQVLNSA